MKHIARKRFGQHFLTDRLVIQNIVEAIAPQSGQRMVEIGPGLAALTRPLAGRLGHLTVIELDRDLARQLRAQPKLTVIEADVLRVDFRLLAEQIWREAPIAESAGATQAVPPSQSGLRAVNEATSVGVHKLRVVGNLPYNISTPILFHLLGAVDLIEDQHFMLQKEVIDRMVALPSTSAYGRLSVMLQWRYAMENVLAVPPRSFDPPPRVDSAIVRMEPHAEPVKLDVKLLSELVRTAFSQRRKLLRHALGPWLERHEFTGEFDLKRRAEEVPVAEYLALAKHICYQ